VKNLGHFSPSKSWVDLYTGLKICYQLSPIAIIVHLHHCRQPDMTRSALSRQHDVPATKMSFIHWWACIFLLRPTCMECSAL